MVVVRQAGIFGRVQVNYTTIAGTATSDEDYLKKTNGKTAAFDLGCLSRP